MNNVITSITIIDLVGSGSSTKSYIDGRGTTGTSYPLKQWFFRGHYTGTGEAAFNAASAAYTGLQLAWNSSTDNTTPSEADIVPHLKYYLQVQTKHTGVSHSSSLDNMTYEHDLLKRIDRFGFKFCFNHYGNPRGEGGPTSCANLGFSGSQSGDFWFTQPGGSGILSFYGVTNKVDASTDLASFNTKFPMISYVRYTGETGFGEGTGGGGSVTLASADTNVSNMIGGTAQTMTTTTFNFDGNVGIGETNPAAKLHINSSSTRAIKIDGTNGTSAPLWITGTTYGPEFNTGNTDNNKHALSVKGNNSAILYCRCDGNVGIGTTSPDSKLTIVSAQGTNNTLELQNLLPQATGKVIFQTPYVGNDVGLAILTGGSSPTERMRIRPDGNVAIGGGVGSSAYPLYVYGNTYIHGTLYATNAAGINITGSSGSCTGNAATATTATKVSCSNTGGTNANYYIPFCTTAGNVPLYCNTSSGAGAMQYNPYSNALTCGTFSGNLSGNATTATTAGTVTTAAQPTITSLGILTSLNVNGNIGGTNGILVNGNGVGISHAAPTNSTYRLEVGGSVKLDSNLIVDGNVGIGTTSPQARLHVDGGVNSGDGRSLVLTAKNSNYYPNHYTYFGYGGSHIDHYYHTSYNSYASTSNGGSSYLNYYSHRHATGLYTGIGGALAVSINGGDYGTAGYGRKNLWIGATYGSSMTGFNYGWWVGGQNELWGSSDGDLYWHVVRNGSGHDAAYIQEMDTTVM